APKAKSPSSYVQAYWATVWPLTGVAVAVKWTVMPLAPDVWQAVTVTVGARPEAAGRRNQVVVAGSGLKKASSMRATFLHPLALGCVASLGVSDRTQVKPSERGLVPLAHRYGPHNSSGATTLPLDGSELRLPLPLIWSWIVHFTAKPDS